MIDFEIVVSLKSWIAFKSLPKGFDDAALMIQTVNSYCHPTEEFDRAKIKIMNALHKGIKFNTESTGKISYCLL